MADAALDFDSDVNELTMKSRISNIRDRLEKILLPPRPKATDDAALRGLAETLAVLLSKPK